MKYIICALALFLTACYSTLSATEVKGRERYCYQNNAKGTRMLIDTRTRSVYDVRCVFDGYETPSEYVEEKK